MFQQAARADQMARDRKRAAGDGNDINDETPLKRRLESMEANSASKFIEHLQDFCQRHVRLATCVRAGRRAILRQVSQARQKGQAEGAVRFFEGDQVSRIWAEAGAAEL